MRILPLCICVVIGFSAPALAEPTTELIKKVPPVYPKRALSRGIEGKVTIAYDIDKTGSVLNPRVIQSDSSLLDNAALTAVSQYLFTAPTEQGMSVIAEDRKTVVRFEIMVCGDGIAVRGKQVANDFIHKSDSFECARRQIDNMVAVYANDDNAKTEQVINAPSLPVKIAYSGKSVVSRNNTVNSRSNTSISVNRNTARGNELNNKTETETIVDEVWQAGSMHLIQASDNVLNLLAGRGFTATGHVTEDQWINGTLIEGGTSWTDVSVTEQNGNTELFPLVMGKTSSYYEKQEPPRKPDDYGVISSKLYESCIPTDLTSVKLGEKNFPAVRLFCAKTLENVMFMGEMETQLMRWVFVKWVSTDYGITLKTEGTASALSAYYPAASYENQVTSITLDGISIL